MPRLRTPDVYIATMGEAAKLKATKLCMDLRNEGFTAVTDVAGRSVKAQMKYADKIGADKYAKDAMETVRYAECVI